MKYIERIPDLKKLKPQKEPNYKKFKYNKYIYRMVMLTDFNQKIIPDYSPISARGGSRRRRSKKLSRKLRTRKHNRSNKSRTRRRYR